MKIKLKLQMKRKSFLIMVGIVFLALIVNIVSAGIWDDFLNLFSDEKAIDDITRDDVYKELILNDAIKTEAIFTLKNPINDVSIKRDDIKINFNEVCGNVNSYKVLINSSCEAERVKEYIYDIKLICYNNSVIDNKTFKNITKEICNNESFIKNIIYENYTYTCYNEFEKIDASDLRNIKIEAEINWGECSNGVFGYKIDWIPEITFDDGIKIITLDNKEWEWWNYTTTGFSTDPNDYLVYNDSITTVGDSAKVSGFTMSKTNVYSCSFNLSAATDWNTNHFISLRDVSEVRVAATMNTWSAANDIWRVFYNGAFTNVVTGDGEIEVPVFWSMEVDVSGNTVNYTGYIASDYREVVNYEQATTDLNTITHITATTVAGEDTITFDLFCWNGTITERPEAEAPPPTYSLNGTVKDSNSVLVNNATIIIINQTDNTIFGLTNSNSTGGWNYSLGYSIGTYLVVAYDPNNSTRDGDADPHVIVS